MLIDMYMLVVNVKPSHMFTLNVDQDGLEDSRINLVVLYALSSFSSQTYSFASTHHVKADALTSRSKAHTHAKLSAFCSYPPFHC